MDIEQGRGSLSWLERRLRGCVVDCYRFEPSPTYYFYQYHLHCTARVRSYSVV